VAEIIQKDVACLLDILLLVPIFVALVRVMRLVADMNATDLITWKKQILFLLWTFINKTFLQNSINKEE